MTEPIKPAGSIEKYLDETIFEYLRGQTEVAESYAHDFIKTREPGLKNCQKPLKISNPHCRTSGSRRPTKKLTFYRRLVKRRAR